MIGANCAETPLYITDQDYISLQTVNQPELFWSGPSERGRMVILSQPPTEHVLILDQFAWKGGEFRFRKPRHLPIQSDSQDGTFYIEDPELHLFASAEDLERLVVETLDELWILWEEIALENEHILDPTARVLKATLLDLIEEVSASATR